jgi:hypothetical protein
MLMNGKGRDNSYWKGCAEKETHLVDESIIWYSHYGKQYEVSFRN